MSGIKRTSVQPYYGASMRYGQSKVRRAICQVEVKNMPAFCLPTFDSAALSLLLLLLIPLFALSPFPISLALE